MAGILNNQQNHTKYQSHKQKHQQIIFFKSILRFLHKLITNTQYQKISQVNIIFDLKKNSKSISLQLFMKRILSYFKCGQEVYICSLCLINRMVQSQEAYKQNFKLTIKNIYKIISVALLISTKNFDDFYFTNTYYARVCGLSLTQLNLLEKQFLKLIDFDVFVNQEEYNIYQTLIENYKRKIKQAEFIDTLEMQNQINQEIPFVKKCQSTTTMIEAHAQTTEQFITV